MGRRTIQEVLASDPNYSGTFDANGVVGSPRTPASKPQAPQRREQQSPTTGTGNDVDDGGPEVVRVEPAAQPTPAPSPKAARAPAPVPKARKAEAVRAQARTPVSVRVRPLATQADRIAATGVKPRQVMKAAWRQAVESCTVGPAFIDPPEDERAAGLAFQFETTLMVDADALAALAHERDPLGVESPWSLIRGQLEPTFWAALDAILAQLAKPSPT